MKNLDRMIHLAEDFFETRSDPAQISVTEETMEKLRRIHPGTLSEESNDDGPVAWILVIPTTHELMDDFITGRINERELLDRTPLETMYEALYLCSALVLPEFRGKGIAKRLALHAVKSIRVRHPIRWLFYWSFSPEGEKLAAALAKETGLPLFRRASQ